MKSIVFFLFTLLYVGYSHSWLHCVKYDQNAPLNVGTIDNSKCAGFPRDMSISSVFGVDQGINYKPTNEKPCRSAPISPVNYKQGSTYRLLWPAKNHQADTCTNAYIPDNQLKVYFYPTAASSADPTLTEWTQAKYLVQDFKAQGKGFQNCPDFCSNTGLAPCYGDLKIPNLPSGYYRALWYWEFNAGEFYTHCFDVALSSESSTPTSPPADSLTGSPTSPPAQNPNCSDLYQQCGGDTWQGPKCCKTGLCVVTNNWYSQCLAAPTQPSTPTKPPTQPPSSTNQSEWKLCYCKC